MQHQQWTDAVAGLDRQNSWALRQRTQGVVASLKGPWNYNVPYLAQHIAIKAFPTHTYTQTYLSL